MSDYRALAGVSATLRTLLRDRMELPPGFTGDRIPISIGTPTAPPEQTTGEPVAEGARLNIFLYQVQEHAQLKNYDLPGQGAPLAYGKPPLSLHLNLMLTAYGSEVEEENGLNETVAQYVLGSAMRVLHDYPTITAQMQTLREPIGQPILHESLHNADETIKLSLDPISLEDLTKVWTALTIPYRLSVAYAVSVVQIESQATRTYPRLVGEPPLGGPGIVAVPLDRPRLDAVAVRRLGDPSDLERTFPYVRVGDTLILHGGNFHRVIEVDLNGLIIPIIPPSSTRLEVEIPDATLDGETIPPESRLQPGAQPVEVLSAIEGLETFRLRSNRMLFMLAPLISTITTAAPRTVTIHGQRLYLADSAMQTLIGHVLFDGAAYTTATPTAISLTLPDGLPHRRATGFVGQPITDLASLDPTVEIRVQIGTDGPHLLAFGMVPTTLEEAATELERVLQGAPTENSAFRGARVSLLDDRLLIVPGGLQGAITVQTVDGNQAATILGLSSGVDRVGYLSGPLVPFTSLSNPAPAVRIDMDGATFDAILPDVPQDLTAAALNLQDAIQAGPTTAFADTQVAVLGDQLFVLTGGDAPILFGPVTGGAAVDETTVSELALRRDYAVRVRVNGAESLGNVNSLELPI